MPAGKTGGSDLFKKNKFINYAGPVKPEKKGFDKAGKFFNFLILKIFNNKNSGFLLNIKTLRFIIT